jgi:hypothetical protein
MGRAPTGGWAFLVWVVGAGVHGVASQSCAQSPDASLVELTVSAGGGADVACIFDTAFDPMHEYYECQLPHVEHDVVVTPLPADYAAEMEVRRLLHTIHLQAPLPRYAPPQRTQSGLRGRWFSKREWYISGSGTSQGLLRSCTHGG